MTGIVRRVEHCSTSTAKQGKDTDQRRTLGTTTLNATCGPCVSNICDDVPVAWELSYRVSSLSSLLD